VSRKLMVCPYFGEFPEWWDRYQEQIPMEGYDFFVDTDLAGFKQRVGDILGIECPATEGSSKIHDYRAVLGVLYADEIAPYDWWGHTDFDCVYGRLDHFVTDEVLADCDVFSDCAYDYLAGPFTLYRVGSDAHWMFRHHPGWKSILEDETVLGWVETSFTEIAKHTVKVKIQDHHAFQQPELLWKDGKRLMHGHREISYFHFNRSKVWPLDG